MRTPFDIELYQVWCDNTWRGGLF